MFLAPFVARMVGPRAGRRSAAPSTALATALAPALAFALATLHPAGPAAAQTLPLPRDGHASGAVVSRLSGETVRLVEESGFRGLALGQDLIGGDLVRTGAEGLVSILFVDQTIMRLHRDSELLVNAVTPDAAVLTLRRGEVWARARRGGPGLELRTPTAAAAIRGTDWSLAVEGDGATRLSVYDGVVDLSNALGSVTVNQGQQALAAPGRPPVIVRVASRKEQAQMLYALSPASALDPLAGTAETLAARVPAVPAAPEALARYRQALDAFRRGDADAAAAGFEAAAPGLDPERRSAARWLAAFARVEAGRPYTPPQEADATATAVAARGLAAALAGDLDAAARGLEATDAPASLSAALQVALLRDDTEAARAIRARLLADAPDDPDALEADAIWLAGIEGDHRAAAARLQDALRLAPERSSLWNLLGLEFDALDRGPEAEAAFGRAMTLAPGDPAPAANLAILLLDQERLPEAQARIAALLRDDPGGYLGLRAEGRAQLQTDDPAAADTLLRALAAQPGAAESSILLAIAAWQDGDAVRAGQELDAAARLDPNDPLPPEIRAEIALDGLEVDEAIRQAREARRLQRAQGGEALRLAADRRTGSRLARGYSLIGLEDWARDAGDASFDPLSAESLFAEGLARRMTLGRDGLSASGGDAASLQGLQLDPLATSARLIGTDLLRRPFVDAALSGTRALGDVDGAGGALRLESFSRAGLPLAVSAELGFAEFDGPGEEHTGPRNASLVTGTRVGARLGLFALADWERDRGGDDGFVRGAPARDFDTSEARSFGLGGSVQLDGRGYLTAFASFNDRDGEAEVQRIAFNAGASLLDLRTRQTAEAGFGGLGWRAEDASGAWSAGIEAQHAASDTRSEATVTDLLTGSVRTRTARLRDDETRARAFLDRRQRFGPTLEAQAGAAAGVEDGARSGVTLAPHAGLAWTPAEGRRLRLAVLRDDAPDHLTLAPVTVLGLAPLRGDFGPGGELWGGIARWDADLGGRAHIALEHQSLRLEQLSYVTGDALIGFAAPRADLHATELSGDLWLGAGFGAHAALLRVESRIVEGPSKGRPLPDTPEWTTRFGVTWTSPTRLTATVDAVWTDDSWSGIQGARLGAVWSLDAGLGWETPDRRLALSLAVRNMLDADVERPFGQSPLGRAAWLSVEARF